MIDVDKSWLTYVADEVASVDTTEKEPEYRGSLFDSLDIDLDESR